MARLGIGGLAGALLMVFGFAPTAMAAPVSHFRINNVALTEGNAGTTNLTFAISYTGTLNDISVDWGTASGTATSGADFTSSFGTATFLAAGPTSQNITIPIVGDLLDEANETFTVNLTNPQPPATADITVFTGTGTINDNDPTPTIVINDVSLTEGNAGTSNADFAVSLSAPSGRNVTVNYATANGTAVQPGDYTTTSGTLTFLPGQVLQTLPVPIVGDLVDENNETYVVNLSGATNATIADAQGAGTVVNDDTPPSISLGDASLTEGNAGTANLTFTATMSSASGKTVTVAFASADGTALAGSDYNAAAGTVTFTAGQTSRPVTVAVRGDTLDEFDETFAVNLSAPTNASISDSQGVGTIIDNDTPPSLAINNVSVTEVDAGTVTATFTVTASAASGKTMMVDYATGDVSATAPADYAATSGTFTFIPGQTTKTVVVTVQGDVLDESNETYAVSLSNAVNATTAATGVGTITDNDATPSLVINDVTVTEGNAGTVNATYTVTLSAPSGRNVTVNYATANGTATAPADYTAATGNLTFLPGTTTRPVTVTVVGDLLNEANDTYVVNLSGATNATIADTQGAGSITNDDPLPNLAINDATLTEGDAGTTTAAFTVSLSAPSGRNVTVNFGSANGTAVQPGDYTSTSGTLTFIAGTTTMPVNVSVAGDLLNEIDETFVVNLTTPGNATIADTQGLGTITNNDPAPSLSINDVSLTEGNSGTTAMVFTVSLSTASGKTVTVLAATANGTAVAPSDYTTTSATVTFTPGQTTRTFSVPVRGDIVVEPDESFLVNLSGATNATIADAQGVGSVANNDLPPTISINDVSLTEGDAGTANVTFTVALSWATGSTVTVAAATATATAVAPADYTTTSGTVTFTAGQTSRTFAVPVRGDLLDEFDETFLVNLSGAVNATISDAQGIGTIVDNDPTPTVVVNDVTLTEGDSGQSNATFTLTLSAASGKTVTIDAATGDGTAAQPGDYAATSSTVTFTPGQTTRPFVVAVNGDAIDEFDETFVVNLSNPTNATIADAQGGATITDDDPLPRLSITDVTIAEGDAGTTTVSFDVTLSPASGKVVSVDYATADGIATSPSDFTLAAGALTFNPGQTTKTGLVSVNGDTTDELDETFLVNLTNESNATVLDGQGTGTITDDDAAPLLSISDVAVAEGDAGTPLASFDVALSATSGKTITVDYVTADGTATQPGDYASAGGTLTFNAGQISKTVDVTVNADLLNELDETFTVDLSGAVNAAVADDQGIGTVVDDDATPTVSVADTAIPEGDAGTSVASFAVTLSAPSGKTVAVDYATADGTATQPGDYAIAAGTVTFNPGQTSKAIHVPVDGDLAYELDETFDVSLSNPANVSPGGMSATGTIQDDDPFPSVVVDDPSVTEGDAGSTSMTFTVSLSNPSAFAMTVDAATVDDTAGAPADYSAFSAGLTFNPGQVSKTVDVDVAGDVLFEGNERLELHLSNVVGASVSDGVGVGTIVDDEAAPTIDVGDVTVAEGDSGPSTATFTVTLAGPTALTATVDATTVVGSADLSDFDASATTLTFLPGQTTHTFDVVVHGDTTFENDEDFQVQLANQTAAQAVGGVGVGTIANDDGAPGLSVDDVSLPEGDVGTTPATFTVSLGNPSAFLVSVDVATQDGTATAPGDYEVTSTTVTFQPGETSHTVDVPVEGDTVFEGDETFAVLLANEVGASVSVGTGYGTIVDDEAAPDDDTPDLTVSMNDVRIAEGDDGSVAPATFTVRLSRGTPGLSVDYSTLDASAVGETDFATTIGTVTFPAGRTSMTIEVPVIGDGAIESNETFAVRLSNLHGAHLVGGDGIGTIVNDDKEATRITLRAKGRHHLVVARGRMLHAEPGMRVHVVLLKRHGHGFVKIARDTVQIHIRGRGDARAGIFKARFAPRSGGRYVVRAVYRGDAMHMPAHARAHVRL